MKKKYDILFICKRRTDPYTSNVGLVSSARLVNEQLALLTGGDELERINGLVVIVEDANAIDKVVHEYRPKFVILEAIWVPPYKLEELAKKWKSIIWITRVHSKIPFIANEGIALKWLNEYNAIKQNQNNVLIAGNNRVFISDIATMEVEAVYLPNLYPANMPIEQDDEKFEHIPGVINIGCFGALRPMKNQLLQAVAAVRFADKHGYKLNFHINSSRCEQHGDQVLKNLRAYFSAQEEHKLVEHIWTEHAAFLKMLKHMDLGLQVSYSETFNIVTADCISAGVPMVVSSEIDWTPCFAQTDMNDSDEIAFTLGFVWMLKKWGIIHLYRHCLKMYNDKALKVWNKFLKG